jgi:hypothetical protein
LQPRRLSSRASRHRLPSPGKEHAGRANCPCQRGAQERGSLLQCQGRARPRAPGRRRPRTAPPIPRPGPGLGEAGPEAGAARRDALPTSTAIGRSSRDAPGGSCPCPHGGSTAHGRGAPVHAQPPSGRPRPRAHPFAPGRVGPSPPRGVRSPWCTGPPKNGRRLPGGAARVRLVAVCTAAPVYRARAGRGPGPAGTRTGAPAQTVPAEDTPPRSPGL